jgi:hypothetical protein
LSLKLCRNQEVTITTADRYSCHTRDSQIHNRRSHAVSRTRRGRERSSTCSWWRRAEDLELQGPSRTHRASGGHDERQEDRQHRREAYLQTAATSIAPTRADYSVGTTSTVTHLCQVMLDEFQRRNDAKSMTIFTLSAIREALQVLA